MNEKSPHGELYSYTLTTADGVRIAVAPSDYAFYLTVRWLVENHLIHPVMGFSAEYNMIQNGFETIDKDTHARRD